MNLTKLRFLSLIAAIAGIGIAQEIFSLSVYYPESRHHGRSGDYGHGGYSHGWSGGWSGGGYGPGGFGWTDVVSTGPSWAGWSGGYGGRGWGGHGQGHGWTHRGSGYGHRGGGGRYVNIV